MLLIALCDRVAGRGVEVIRVYPGERELSISIIANSGPSSGRGDAFPRNPLRPRRRVHGHDGEVVLEDLYGIPRSYTRRNPEPHGKGRPVERIVVVEVGESGDVMPAREGERDRSVDGTGLA